MTVLITGSEGFIGNQLKRHLPDAIGLDIKPSADVQHDIREPLPDIDDVDAIVHLAALTGIQQCEENTELAYFTNVAGTRNVIGFCIENNVKHLIFASSASTYRGDSLYAKTKQISENQILLHSMISELSASILRFANVYGFGFPYKDKLTVVHEFILKAFLGQPLDIHGDGTQTRDFVNVEDVCHVIMYAIEHEVQGVRYVGTQRQTSINDLASIIKGQMQSIYHREIETCYVPERRETPYTIEIPPEHLHWGWTPRITLGHGIQKLLRSLT